jgi:FkbM family methyltransferase
VTNAPAASVAVSPRWARAYRRYGQTVPNHPGKGRIMRALHGVGLRSRRPFACRMSNGTWLAIWPEEGLLGNETVGWTCFRERSWDPHVEACIRRTLVPGDTAIDVGANLGYMTAAMAQCVGPAGQVWAFEPVDETYELLEVCRALNGFDQVTTARLALGAAEGSAEITYDRRHSGLATMHPERVGGEAQRVTVRTLDALVAAGEAPPRPALVKIDVEGHELDVLQGAQATIGEGRPAIVFEVNERAATAAGWTLADAATLLTSLAEYRFWLIDGDGERPLDPFAFRLEGDELSDPHADVLARVA